MKRWFDPWPVFFKREFNRTWPFLVGFAVTGAIITKFSLGLTGDVLIPNAHLDGGSDDIWKSSVPNFRVVFLVVLPLLVFFELTPFAVGV